MSCAASPKDGYRALIECLLFGKYIHYLIWFSYSYEDGTIYLHFTVEQIKPHKNVSNLSNVIQLVTGNSESRSRY